SSIAFRLSSIVHGQPLIVPGEYFLHTNSSFSDVRAALNSGPNVTDIKVLPGQTLSEVAHDMTTVSTGFAKEFLDEATKGAVASPFQPTAGATLEGLIGTGSYRVLPDE